MKRALAVVLVVAATVAAFVPVLLCPDCLGAAVSDSGFAPGCPRCGDGGRISAFGRVSRRSLDPDLAVLVSEPWHALRTDADRFGPALRRLLDRSGVDTLEVGADCVGQVIFADEGRLLGLFRSRLLASPPASEIVLFDRAGEVLDRATVLSESGQPDLPAELRRGGEAVFRTEVPLLGRHRFSVLSGSSQRAWVGEVLRVRPNGGRLEVSAGP